MDTTLQRITDSEENTFNHSYWLVKPITEAIQEGSETKLLNCLQPLLKNLEHPSGHTSMIRLEFTFVSLINTFMIAAIQSDVYPPYANWVADQAINHMIHNNKPSHLSQLILDSAKTFCKLVVQEKEQNEAADHFQYIKETKRYIKTHITQPITLNHIADHLGISKNYLCKVFKNHTQETVNQFLQQERVKVAKQLLEMTNYSIPTIATMLQFCDQSYFTAIFKKYTGRTPKQYRLSLMKPN